MSLDPTLLAAGLPATGHICLVGAGPGAADLLTLRAVRRLAEADVVFYDRLVEPEVVAMAGPRAETVFVGKEVGLHSWPQEKIDAAIVAAALAGKRVVRLKSGDPSVFGRACEEIEAARAAGLPVEIVPGVTAASAAAAQMLRPLTERGQTDRLVIATATCRPGEQPQRLAASLTPGTTLALYMAMHRLHLIRDELLADGIAPDTAIDIVSGAETRRQRMLATRLECVCEDVAAAGIGNPAIVFIRIAKPALAAGLAETARLAAG
ncbi:uroporphyrinogen-III C-methyltransferase [Frigidibacter sp. MR17.24]|uniref:uroporphyrinogen-III C-methyltransferase n=1 Tax=Frigidibacter sp. MR17.24 TaxID=3127345 RepID=UPI003012E54E